LELVAQQGRDQAHRLDLQMVEIVHLVLSQHLAAATADTILIQQERPADREVVVQPTALFPVRQQDQPHSQHNLIQAQVLTLAFQEVQVQMDHGEVVVVVVLAVLDRPAMLEVALMAVTAVLAYLLVLLDTLYITVVGVADLVKVDHWHWQQAAVVLVVVV
jgi:hypothetical protein